MTVLRSLAVNFGRVTSLLQVILYLPLTLDVAGHDAFLALSASLACYYGILSTVRLLTRRTRLHWLGEFLAIWQFLVIPACLLVVFHVYSPSQDGYFAQLKAAGGGGGSGSEASPDSLADTVGSAAASVAAAGAGAAKTTLGSAASAAVAAAAHAVAPPSDRGDVAAATPSAAVQRHASAQLVAGGLRGELWEEGKQAVHAAKQLVGAAGAEAGGGEGGRDSSGATPVVAAGMPAAVASGLWKAGKRWGRRVAGGVMDGPSSSGAGGRAALGRGARGAPSALPSASATPQRVLSLLLHQTLRITFFLARHVPPWWHTFLRWSSPMFSLLEGVSTLLVIQVVGSLSRWCIARALSRTPNAPLPKNAPLSAHLAWYSRQTAFALSSAEALQLFFLLASALTYCASAAALYASFDGATRDRPGTAAAIGAAVSSTLWLTGIAFALRKGNVVETSLMFAYVAFNFYQLSDSLNFTADPMALIRSFQQAASTSSSSAASPSGPGASGSAGPPPLLLSAWRAAGGLVPTWLRGATTSEAMTSGGLGGGGGGGEAVGFSGGLFRLSSSSSSSSSSLVARTWLARLPEAARTPPRFVRPLRDAASQSASFLAAAAATLPRSVLVSLVYRLMVLYLASRILPLLISGGGGDGAGVGVGSAQGWEEPGSKRRAARAESGRRKTAGTQASGRPGEEETTEGTTTEGMTEEDEEEEEEEEDVTDGDGDGDGAEESSDLEPGGPGIYEGPERGKGEEGQEGVENEDDDGEEGQEVEEDHPTDGLEPDDDDVRGKASATQPNGRRRRRRSRRWRRAQQSGPAKASSRRADGQRSGHHYRAGAPKEDEQFGTFVEIVVAYSRLTLIATYSHLLLLDQSHAAVWRLLTVCIALGIWFLEIALGTDDAEQWR